MRDDFAVFILTHGRADNVVTMKTLRKHGYAGRWYMIIDDEDPTADAYGRSSGRITSSSSASRRPTTWPTPWTT